MVTLLYHWNFTGENNLAINDIFYDSKSNLQAVFKSRGTVSNSNFSRNENGIYFNNSSLDSGGYYIDLEGLDNINLGGNITIELALKNLDRTRNSIYFQSIRDVEGESNSESAFVTCKFSSKTKISVRTDKTSEITYNFKTASESSSTQINNNDEYHYIFSINYSASSSSTKIFINGESVGQNTSDLEKSLSNTVRQSNLIGTQKNPDSATYLNGVVKFIKIYQNSVSSDEAYNIYNNYNNSVYWSDISSQNSNQKYERRHNNVSSYFTENTSDTSFTILGNQLGLSNNTETYHIYKFVSGNTINIDNSYNYIPIQGKNNFIILKYNSNYFKITQTSDSDDENSKYKCELSINSNNDYNEVCSNKGFGDTYIYNNITIIFGGVEFVENNEICFHRNTKIMTDQGEVKIKNLRSYHTIDDNEIIYIIKSSSKPTHLVEIKKNSIGQNIPSNDLLLTPSHIILLHNKTVRASQLVNNENIKIVENDDSYVYNFILVNNNFVKISNLNLNVFGISQNYLDYLLQKKEKNVKYITIFPSSESRIKIDLEKIKNF